MNNLVVSEAIKRASAGGYVSKSNITALGKIEIRYNTGRLIRVERAANGTAFQPGLDSRHLAFNTGSVVGTAGANLSIQPLSVDQELASRSPRRRLIYLAKQRTSDFLLYVISVVVCIYISFLSIGPLTDQLLKLFSTKAYAIDAAVNTNSTDYGPYLLFMMGSILAWSLGALTFSKTPKQLEIARDTMRTILAVVLGFFSGAGATKGR